MTRCYSFIIWCWYDMVLWLWVNLLVEKHKFIRSVICAFSIIYLYCHVMHLSPYHSVHRSFCRVLYSIEQVFCISHWYGYGTALHASKFWSFLAPFSTHRKLQMIQIYALTPLNPVYSIIIVLYCWLSSVIASL